MRNSMFRRWHLIFAFVVVLASFALSRDDRLAAAQDSTLTHIVQPGETLLDLSLFYGIPFHELAALNNLDRSRRVGAGQAIAIPVSFKVQTAQEAESDQQTTASEQAPTSYIVQRGDTLFRIATAFNIPMDVLAAANQITDYDRIFVGQQLIIPADAEGLVAPQPPPQETEPPPAAVTDGKVIVVVLSEQKVYAYESGELVREFVVSTGLPATPTVQGTFAIYLKYDAQRMTGPGYDLPNVPWVMYFYRGYSFHGTYWHNNFGQPMSHGCVNMRTPEAEWLYNWAPLGTPVQVIN